MISKRTATRGAFFIVSLLAGMGYSHMHNVSAQDAGAAAAGLIGWLNIEPETGASGRGSRLAITGQAFAAGGIKGRYTLDIRRTGKGGTSNSRQSGDFTISAGQAAQLSRTAINVEPADRLEFELKLFSGEEEVFALTAKSSAPAAARRL